MQAHYERLGLQPGATPAEIKAAYHAQLKAFPAHSHPQEFKAIRAAYEALRKAPPEREDWWDDKPLAADIDPALLKTLRQQVAAELEITLEDLLLLTF